MEEEGEPVEEEVGEEEFRETPARKRSGRRILVLVVVIIAVLAFTGVYFLFLRNAPPNAEFTYNSVDKHLFVNAENTTDPDDSIASYSWNWGDGSPVDSGNLVTATHDFPQERIPYTVTLTVRDSRGASGTATHSITLVILPTPLFIARQAGMTTSFDAGQSTASPGKTIASYRWNFGDGGTNTSRVTTHTYANPGRYVVSLNVTQPDGLSNTVARYVSANTTTVDILANQFFVSGCPYNNYWDLRYRTYGDQILRRPSPCTDFYPWILYKGHPDTNPSFVYTLYRFDARVTNNLGYSVWQPVMLPVFNASVVPSPSSYIHLNFTFNYLNNTDIAYWDNTSWPVNSKYSDGFGYLVRGTVQMDLQESKRIFDVGDPVPFSPTANFTSQWKNSNNGLSSDNRYTTTSMNGAITEYGNYSVPQLASSPIQEVEVGLEAHSAGDDQVRVDFSTDGGLTWATAGTVTPGATDGTTFIDVTSLRTWTVPLLSDTNFRTRIAYVQVGPTNSTVFVDWVPIRVQSISPAWWWSASTELGGSNVGPLENAVGVWLDQQGNGKYDIWNGFQWYYESDIADLNAAVAPDGTTTVTIFLDGWGLDTLMARWFYWGSASYHDAVCVVGYGTCTQTLPYGAIKPAGWMPFETCWCENATVDANITRSLNLDYQATSEYWMGAVGNPGPDGFFNTTTSQSTDDRAGWAFSPSLMDYVPRFGSGLTGESSFPNSELRWYEQSTGLVTTPGSYAYGQRYEYMVVPNRWNMSLGNTLTLVLPRFPVPWYDPLGSYWDSVGHIGRYTTFMSTMTLREVTPTVPGQGYYLWDGRGKVLSLAAPSGFAWPNANNLPLDPAPYIEFGPESTG